MICRNCGAGLEADGIDTSLGVVTCSHCGSLHDIPGEAHQGSSSDQSRATSTKPKRMEVALPSRFKVRRGSGNMEITWSAGGPFHGLVLSIMAGGVAYMAVSSGMLFLLVASIGLLYFAAVRTFNKHRLRVDKALLLVIHGPLPWPGTRKLDASDITQLFAMELESREETGSSGNRKVQVRKRYRLSANTGSGDSLTILSGLNDPMQALWLEQEIERLLGITDRPVVGEYQS